MQSDYPLSGGEPLRQRLDHSAARAHYENLAAEARTAAQRRSVRCPEPYVDMGLGEERWGGWGVPLIIGRPAALALAVVLGTSILAAPAPVAASSNTILVGATVHPWHQAAYANGIQFVAASSNAAGLAGRAAVRIDLGIPSTSVTQVAYDYDQAAALGLQVDIVLVETVAHINDPLVFSNYLTQLVPVMGARHPIAIEISNEENRPVSSPTTPWNPGIYATALANAHAAAGPLAYAISMGGLSLNDTGFLYGMGNFAANTAFTNVHPYTSGVYAGVPVGPLAPDDLNLAQGGLYSFAAALGDGAITNKPVFVGEFGELDAAFPTQAQRQAYYAESVLDAERSGAAAILTFEIGTSDGTAWDNQGACTPTNLTDPSCAVWESFLAAAR